MKKMLYQQLTEFILNKLPTSYRNNFYSWMENGRLLNEGKNITSDGITIAHIEYESVFLFENLPYRKISPYKLLALTQIWVNENDELAEILDFAEIPFEIEIIDDESAEFSLTIKFRETITARKNEKGDLEINDEKYLLDEIQVDFAEAIDILSIKGE